MGTIVRFKLGADFDDGHVAWVNGIEVARSETMPPGAPVWDTSAGLHESSNGLEPVFGPLVDITTVGLPQLVEGPNVLAIGAWNQSAVSTDLVLAPQLI